MEALSKRLRKAIAQGFRHDGKIIVVATFKIRSNFVNFLSCRDGKGTDIIDSSAVAWSDEIRQLEVRLARGLSHLLAHAVKDHQWRSGPGIRVKLNILADPICRPKAEDTSSAEASMARGLVAC